MYNPKHSHSWSEIKYTNCPKCILNRVAPEMADASKDFLDGWLHFCDCIDFAKSNLDADAVRFMNEVPGKIQTAFRAATK